MASEWYHTAATRARTNAITIPSAPKTTCMSPAFGRIWDRFRAGGLWRLLRRSDILRSSLYLTIELHSSWREPRRSGRVAVDRDLAQRRDPWRYETSPQELERFRNQTDMIDAECDGRHFRKGLEIGCAEGKFTEVLAQRCDSLVVLDISPTALRRASERQRWPAGVTFAPFDLRSDAVPGRFDLIVVAGVLEYFSRRTTMATVRTKLAGALEPGGYLLVESTRANPVVEQSWWGRLLVRGKWINEYISREPSLEVVTARIVGDFAITLCRKTGRLDSRC